MLNKDSSFTEQKHLSTSLQRYQAHAKDSIQIQDAAFFNVMENDVSCIASAHISLQFRPTYFNANVTTDNFSCSEQSPAALHAFVITDSVAELQREKRARTIRASFLHSDSFRPRLFLKD